MNKKQVTGKKSFDKTFSGIMFLFEEFIKEPLVTIRYDNFVLYAVALQNIH